MAPLDFGMILRSWLALLLLVVCVGCAAHQPQQTQEDIATALRAWRLHALSKYSFQIQYLYRGCEWARARVRYDEGEIKATMLGLNGNCAEHLRQKEPPNFERGITDLLVETTTFLMPPHEHIEFSATFDKEYGYPVNVRVDTDWPNRGEAGVQEWEFEYRISRFRVYK